MHFEDTIQSRHFEMNFKSYVCKIIMFSLIINKGVLCVFPMDCFESLPFQKLISCSKEGP